MTFVTFALAGYSPDEQPAETPFDPGDAFFIGGALEVDDTCPPIFPSPVPCLGVPDSEAFDLDALSLKQLTEVCSGLPTDFPEGILFSLDDGDPGAGVGPPDRSTEIFFYDRCNRFGGGSFRTNADEVFLGLGVNPPPTALDDDVDAYEARDITVVWPDESLFFSPDAPSTGALAPDPACPGSTPEGTIYVAGQPAGLGGNDAWSWLKSGMPLGA